MVRTNRSGFGERSPEPDCHRNVVGVRLVALAAMLCLLHPQASYADEVRITGNACSAGLRIEARDARLSDVLARLASASGFRLSFRSENDPRIDFSGSGEVAALVTRLVAGGNVTIVTAPSPACKARTRVTMVWILPGGGTANAAGAPSRTAERAAPRLPDAPVDPLYAQSHGVALQLQREPVR